MIGLGANGFVKPACARVGVSWFTGVGLNGEASDALLIGKLKDAFYC